MCWQGGAFFQASHHDWADGKSAGLYFVLDLESFDHCSAFRSRLCIARWVGISLILHHPRAYNLHM